MRSSLHFFCALAIVAVLSAPALAVDGVTLINQATVQAAGGFPYTITQPGAYRLSGNLVVNNNTGILINANNVNLDLNGFSISCTGCSGYVIGIYVDATFTTITNGSVSAFTGVGIFFNHQNATIDRMNLYNNAIGVNSYDISISHSTFSGNGQYGIYAGGSLLLTESRFSSNGTGVRAFAGVILGNMFTANQSTGIVGGGGPLLLSQNMSSGNQFAAGTYLSAGNNACGTGTLC